MGDVYRARDEVLKSLVALKALALEVSTNREMTERIKAEVRLARQVTHPNVCRIFDIGLHTPAHDPIVFLTMELLQGETLRDRMARQRIDANELPGIVVQMARALSAVHEAGIVHRDFKPENVMLADSVEGTAERLVVMDFGLARLDASGQSAEVSDGDHSWSISGTPAYMAPELRHGAPATLLSDVYAFGMVLLEMLCGRPPETERSQLPSRSESSMTVSNRLRFRGLPLGLARRKGSLVSLAARCLAPDPADRIRDLSVVARSLEKVHSRSSWTARRSPARAAVAIAVMALVLGAVISARGTRVPGRRGALRPAAAPHATTGEFLPLLSTPTPLREGIYLPPKQPLQKEFPRIHLDTHGKGLQRQRKNLQVAAAEGLETSHEPQSRESPPATDKQTSEDHLLAAEVLMLDGRLTEACARGEELRVHAVHSPAVYRFLGKCYTRAGRAADARTNYRRYLELAPDAADAPFVRGIARESQ